MAVVEVDMNKTQYLIELVYLVDQLVVVEVDLLMVLVLQEI